jgi:hypothetical protein
MGLSSDETARSKQLANLRPNAAQTHGFWSETKLKPLRDSFVLELSEQFPSAHSDEIALLATKRAQISVLSDRMDKRGLLQNRQRGIPFPAVALFNSSGSSYEKQFNVLREREEARQPPTHPAVAAWEAKVRAEGRWLDADLLERAAKEAQVR